MAVSVALAVPVAASAESATAKPKTPDHSLGGSTGSIDVAPGKPLTSPAVNESECNTFAWFLPKGTDVQGPAPDNKAAGKIRKTTADAQFITDTDEEGAFAIGYVYYVKDSKLKLGGIGRVTLDEKHHAQLSKVCWKEQTKS